MTMKEKSNYLCNEGNGRQGSMARAQNSVRKRLSLIKTQHRNSIKFATAAIPLILLCLIVGLTLAQTFQRSINSYGTLKFIGVNVYWNNACTSEVTSIPWGNVTPGASFDNVVYVKNVGTTAETLSMSYGNFTPTVAASYLTLTWNCSGYVLATNAVTCAKITLAVQPNATGLTDFSFGILVQASA